MIWWSTAAKAGKGRWVGYTFPLTLVPSEARKPLLSTIKGSSTSALPPAPAAPQSAAVISSLRHSLSTRGTTEMTAHAIAPSATKEKKKIIWCGLEHGNFPLKPSEQSAPTSVMAALSSSGEGGREVLPWPVGAPGTPRPNPSPKHRTRPCQGGTAGWHDASHKLSSTPRPWPARITPLASAVPRTSSPASCWVIYPLFHFSVFKPIISRLISTSPTAKHHSEHDQGFALSPPSPELPFPLQAVFS